MDIVRITLVGQGYDVVRGIVAKNEYNKIKNSNSLDDVWVKNLNKKITKKLKGFIEDFHNYGITNGDIIVSLNGEEIINLPITALNGYNFNDIELVEMVACNYPKTKEVVITSVQKLVGVFMDEIFITKDNFDFNKFKFVEKIITDVNGNPIVESLIGGVYYDGEIVNFNNYNTELRMSNVYFDTDNDKKVFKDEKDNN